MLDIVTIRPEHEQLLATFFEKLEDREFFQPHPFTAEYAHYLAYYAGNNLYYVAIDTARNLIAAYGFVRGWDEGWPAKCLGVYVNLAYRRGGLGELFCRVIEKAAEWKGAGRLRLHVHPTNKAALRLYNKLGYFFTGEKRDNGELIAYKEFY